VTNSEKYLLGSTAVFGLVVPNGLFLWYLFAEFASFDQILHNRLALGFILDAFLATGLLAWWFSRNPSGRYSWKMFILLSLVGGLGFSLPVFYLLNHTSGLDKRNS
jgi:hypothetical protein